MVIPRKLKAVVLAALGTASKCLDKWIEEIGIKVRPEHIQMTKLLGTARILRRLLKISSQTRVNLQ